MQHSNLNILLDEKKLAKYSIFSNIQKKKIKIIGEKKDNSDINHGRHGESWTI